VLVLPKAPYQAHAGQQYHERVHDAVLAEDDFVGFHEDSSEKWVSPETWAGGR
jgi:hypothetical protein